MIPDGSTPIKNEILIDIFGKGKLNYSEMRIAFYIMRWSWGFDRGKRRQDWTNPISKTKIARDLEMDYTWCCRILDKMVEKNSILRKTQSKGLCYQFNEHYKNWRKVEKNSILRKTQRKVEKNSRKVEKNSSCNVGNAHPNKHSKVLKETPKETIKEIVEFFNSTLSTNFRWQTKQTQDLIKGRLKEGFTMEDFKLVIENRKDKWQNDNKMREYLRPNTLFRPANFESYLQQAIGEKPEELELLERAQKSLGVYYTKDKLLAWLNRLPEKYHKEFQKYPDYKEVKGKWEKQKEKAGEVINKQFKGG